MLTRVYWESQRAAHSHVTMLLKTVLYSIDTNVAGKTGGEADSWGYVIISLPNHGNKATSWCGFRDGFTAAARGSVIC